MSDLEVPEEAIEAAALALRSPSHRPGPPDPDLVEIWKRTARMTLAAAAPLIVAAAIEQEADRIHGTIQAWGYGPNDDPPPNSIAGALCCVSVELRERASVLRGEGDPK